MVRVCLSYNLPRKDIQVEVIINKFSGVLIRNGHQLSIYFLCVDLAELKRKQFISPIMSDWPTVFIQRLALNSLHMDYIYMSPFCAIRDA